MILQYSTGKSYPHHILILLFSDDGMFCIVMKYCNGGDLRRVIDKQEESGILFRELHVLDWFIQICLALQYLHHQRILHRDIKPSVSAYTLINLLFKI